MEPFEDDNFVATLESLRPAPRPAFAAELDERAATGFPRRSRPGSSPLSALVDRLRAIQPRRALVPAGATALAAVAAVTMVVAVNENGGGDPSAIRLDSSTGGSAASAPPASPKGDPSSASSGTGSPAGEAASGASGASAQYEAAVPNAPERGKEVESSAASATAAVKPFSSEEELSPATGPYASRTSHREIERSAEMILGTDPAGVRKAASEVFGTVHAHRGIVLSSSIRDGAEGEAGARFELLIPSARLSDALAGFSGIAEVRSRHEATADITAPIVRTGEQLRDSRAKIEGLLAQLSGADSIGERIAAEAELRAERRHLAYLRSQMSTLERRANFSRVALRIETGAASSSANETDGWSIGDALDDAGHILAIAAGMTIVGLAVVGPLALIALLAWLANRARIRRGRRRALA